MAGQGSNMWFSGDLFPTKLSAVVFVAYMALFINQGILVTASRNSANKYNYSTITAVLFTEILKLIASSVLYLKDVNFKTMFSSIIIHKKVFMLYFVPAILYCIYNNLQFTNLAAYDPTTYYLLLQFRVVVTGVVFQILFSKKLSSKQWVSLLLLTLGCIIKQLSQHNAPQENTTAETFSFHQIFNLNLVFILVQVFCSCFAGVYNEYLLKDTGVDVHIMLQNMFMYVDSIVCNIVYLIANQEIFTAFTHDAIANVFKFKVVCVMINNAAIGIVTSLFLKNLNSILKTFASALELMFTAVLCWIIFGIPVDVYTVIAIAIVSYATWMYSQNPVVNKPKNERELENTEEGKSFLQKGNPV